MDLDENVYRISNDTNDTRFNSFDYWLNQVGSSHLVDTIHCFVIPLLSLVGLSLNLIGLFILADVQFKSARLYGYLRAYLLNSLLICIFGCTLFITARRYVYPNALVGAWYFTHVFCKTMATFYFYANVLDVLVLLDRLSILSDKFKLLLLNKASPCCICLALFVICVIINSPYYFMYAPLALTVNLSSSEQHTFYYMGSSNFLRSQQGQMVSNSLLFVRELLPTTVQLVLSIYLFWMLKAYLSKKSMILRVLVKPDSRGKCKKEKAKRSTLSKDEKSNACSSTIALLPSSPWHRIISKIEQKAILMVLSNSALSFVEHLLTFWGVLYSHFYINLNLFTIAAFALLVIVIKNTSSFLLLILFDQKIRSCFFELFISKLVFAVSCLILSQK
jgi:hypothetical protein